MSVFLSYSSRDAGVVKTLARGLEAAKQDVWFDHELKGGEVWWTSILDNIRNCSVFVFAVSDASSESKPCRSELDYATALARPILPIRVGPVSALRISPLAEMQIMDYDPDDAQSGFAVLAAVQDSARRQRPLPDPLPPEPPIPYLYLLALRRRIDSKELSVDEQREVIDELRHALTDETDESVRQDILTLLENLNRKPWTTKETEKNVKFLLLLHGNGGSGEAGSASVPTAAATSAPAPKAADPDSREWLVDRLERLHRERVAAQPADSDPEPWRPSPDAASQWRRAYDPGAGSAGSVSTGGSGSGGGRAPSGSSGPGGFPGPGGGSVPTGSSGPGGGFPTAGTPGPGGPMPSGASGPGGGFPTSGIPGSGGGFPPSAAGAPPADGGRRPGPAAQPSFFATGAGPQQSAGYPAGGQSQGPAAPPQVPQPPTFWPMSIVSFVLSFLFGGIAMYFSYQVGQRYKAGDVAGARRASTNAKVWGIVGIVVGSLLILSVLG